MMGMAEICKRTWQKERYKKGLVYVWLWPCSLLNWQLTPMETELFGVGEGYQLHFKD